MVVTVRKKPSDHSGLSPEAQRELNTFLKKRHRNIKEVVKKARRRLAEEDKNLGH